MPSEISLQGFHGQPVAAQALHGVHRRLQAAFDGFIAGHDLPEWRLLAQGLKGH